jgi:hypothetical protein
MSVVDSVRRLLQLVEDRLTRRMVFSSLHPYRVQSQNLATDRLNLQAVNEGAVLLPQLVEIPKAHGLQGARERCRPGSIVLVGFQGGSPGAPFVEAYLPATPLELELDAQTEIRLGENATAGAARVGDTVTVLLPPATFVGTIGGSPASGMVIWSGQTTGTITTGSAKVKVE